MTEEHAVPALTEDQIDRLLQAMADSFAQQLRSPILHSPTEHGLDYQDVTFPALDGVPLEGWFIPAAGSDKLIIANHPMGFSRAGIPAHLEPWRSWTVWNAPPESPRIMRSSCRMAYCGFSSRLPAPA
jgi:hypothetical protein